tara:strand:- start:291 stop:824 length:534 start_codon:yes stop_codon:yes gene_type:complete
MLVVLTGGARSGKSRVAMKIALSNTTNPSLIATAEAGEDEEMLERIEMHRSSRTSAWNVIEEPLEIVKSLGDLDPSAVVVIDCISFWISNQIEDSSDEEVFSMLDDLIRVSNERSGLTILVTNEVGSGIVPISFLGRRFRDLLGFANQKLVENADRSFFIVAGKKIPLDDLDYDIAD